MVKNKFIMVIVLIFFSLPTFGNDAKKDYALIISGGISLGAYEAGYNWALMKYLNHLKHQSSDEMVELHSIAGASAGAINSVMSAMAWCRDKNHLDEKNLIENNLFYRMWTQMDFEDLLIDKEFGTIDIQNKTSLFSRKKLEQLSEEMFRELEQPYYEAGCKIPFGFAVTRVKSKISTIQDIKISNKLFHIPLYLTVNNKGVAQILDNYDLRRDNIIHLSHDGFPSINRIRKALFASSAFPIAFEQVELEYFHHNQFEKSLFLDGGVFDNVPLDFARRLSLENANHYIFMDPKHLRRALPPKELQKESAVESPINSAMTLIGDIFSASESSILYNTLAEQFQDNSKQIEVSSRYFPITGMFLEHFGAFLDEGFREYDYFVGVYDAIVDYAKDNCNQAKRVTCEMRKRKSAYELLSKGSNRAKYALNLLSTEEFGYPFERKTYPMVSDLLAIFNAIKTLNYQDMEEFYTFIRKLNEQKYRAKNSYLKHTLAYPNEWYRRPLSSLTHRIVGLEKENSDNLSKALVSVTAHVAGNFYRTKSGYTFNPVSAPLDKKKLWVKYFPYEVALAKNTLSLAYENYYYFEEDGFLMPEAVELKPTLAFKLSDREKKKDFFRVDLNLNYELEKDILTLGFGPSAYRDLSNDVDNKIGFGANVYVDFLNIFRFTYTKRENYAGDRHFFFVGVSDIPSFLYWIEN